MGKQSDDDMPLIFLAIQGSVDRIQGKLPHPTIFGLREHIEKRFSFVVLLSPFTFPFHASSTHFILPVFLYRTFPPGPIKPVQISLCLALQRWAPTQMGPPHMEFPTTKQDHVVFLPKKYMQSLH